MEIDWDIVLKIAVPAATSAATLLVKEIVDKRPKLISYIGHVAAFNVRNLTAGEPPLQVGTHITVIRNAGKKTATNITVSHRFLPDYKIHPPIQHEEREVSGDGKEIFIPRLVAGEEITISYLYQAPLKAVDIIGAIKSDDGFTKVLDVVLTPQQPKWLMRLAAILMFMGVIAISYLIVELLIYSLSNPISTSYKPIA